MYKKTANWGADEHPRKCSCGSSDAKVLKTTRDNVAIIRTRRCNACMATYPTYEQVALQP